MSVAASVLLFAMPQIADTVVVTGPISSPTISSEGILAFEREGDIWIVTTSMSPSGLELIDTPVRIAGDAAWDRHPAWSPDGRRLVFSSNRSGGFDLWQVTLTGDGGPTSPQRLTDAPDDDTEPSVGSDGQVLFVRGHGPQTDIWRMTPDGHEERLTTRQGEVRSPEIHPDQDGFMYVAVDDRRQTLHWYAFTSGESSRILDDEVESPTWSPDGAQIAFTTRSGRRGVWLMPRDARFRNLIAERSAASAWSPDGNHLLLAELPAPEPGYNGDPRRIPDRGPDSWENRGGDLLTISVPASPLPGEHRLAVPTTTTRAERNATTFDRVWNRLTTLYFPNGNAAWETLRQTHRPRAIAAPTDSVLQMIVHELITARPPLRDEAVGESAVSSAHPLATAAGVEILEAGGNVVDAAVAVSFTLGVVEPDASGIGGYGEMVVFTNGMDAPVVIEFLTRVPEHASLDNAALAGDRLPDDGPMLANVPGTVAGMFEAWQRFGSGNVSWARLLEPAIRAASNGFALDDAFPTTLAVERERFLQYEGSRALFFPDGQPLQPGDTLRNPDLAWTLGQIAENGVEGFYQGEVARRMVEDLRGKGNAISSTDLSRYFAALREPVVGTYRGHTIYSGAPAVSGGVSLVGKLHHLDNANGVALYRDDPRSLHALIEAWKLMPSTTGRVADPSLWPVNYDPIINRDSARMRWEQCFDEHASSGPQELRRVRAGRLACMDPELAMTWGEDVLACNPFETNCRSTGTTAFAVADADGNMVAVTQTLGTWGGNFYVTPGLGFLYNDKLRSYSSDPTSYNARIPFARNSTGIAPTLVFRGIGSGQTPYLALGAAGNAWITSAVYQVLSGIVDGRLGPQRALELPRFLVGVRRAGVDIREIVIQTENGFSPDAIRRLEAMGHEFQRISLRGELRMGYGAAVLIDGRRVRAGADPRRSGSAGAATPNVQR